MILKLAEDAALLRKTRSPSARMRQVTLFSTKTSLPQLQPKKVEVDSQPLKRLVEKSKEDFFSKRNSSNDRLRSSKRRDEPIIKLFESEVDKIMKQDSRKGVKRRIENKLQEILAEEQPQLI